MVTLEHLSYFYCVYTLLLPEMFWIEAWEEKKQY